MENKTKKCPYCGEEIPMEAKKCRYCGEWLEPKEVSSQTETEPKEMPSQAENEPKEVSSITKTNYDASEQASNKETSQETPSHTFIEAIKQCFKKYANFKGRAMRREFWFFALFVWGINTICFALIALLSSTDSYGCISIVSCFCFLFILATALPMLAVGTRRLHDIGKSGWYQLFYLVPYIGCFYLWYLWAKEGEGDNKYGKDPEF